MYRGTTPIHIFTTDIDLSEAAAVYITYKQNKHTVVEKTVNDIEFTSEGQTYTMTVGLTQKETLMFDSNPVAVQIRARFDDGRAIASNIVNASVSQILKDGVI